MFVVQSEFISLICMSAVIFGAKDRNLFSYLALNDHNNH